MRQRLLSRRRPRPRPELRRGLRTAITGLAPHPDAYGANGLFAGSWGMRPSFGAWVSASALWLAGSLGMATLAARRQPRG